MLNIIFEIIVSAFAVFGFFCCIMSILEQTLKKQKNYTFNAEIRINPNDIASIEHILTTFEFISKKYFPNIEIYVDTKNLNDENIRTVMLKKATRKFDIT